MTSEYHVQLLGGFPIENSDAGKTRLVEEQLDWTRRQDMLPPGSAATLDPKRPTFYTGSPSRLPVSFGVRPVASTVRLANKNV